MSHVLLFALLPETRLDVPNVARTGWNIFSSTRFVWRAGGLALKHLFVGHGRCAPSRPKRVRQQQCRNKTVKQNITSATFV